MPSYRTFDGKRYVQRSLHTAKSEAQHMAREERKRGYSARVIKIGPLWAVYLRKK